ncbi:MAG: methyltransferase domain-containing protein [Jatrophihabitans sp.]
MTELALTGERTLPGIAGENYWFRRHEAAYLLLAPEVSPGRLLEVGAGEGYGTALLAEQAGFGCALDYDAAAISHLATRYRQLRAVRGNLAALPIQTASIDNLVSLQVIEHVWDHRQFLAECARVLRPGGLLLLSTPNRLTFSPGSDRPSNPFHTHEFTAVELLSLVRAAGFGDVTIRGLHPAARLRELDRTHRADGGFVAAQLRTDTAGWPADLRAEVASVRAADFEIAELPDRDIDSCLDLIVSARWA